MALFLKDLKHLYHKCRADTVIPVLLVQKDGERRSFIINMPVFICDSDPHGADHLVSCFCDKTVIIRMLAKILFGRIDLRIIVNDIPRDFLSTAHSISQSSHALSHTRFPTSCCLRYTRRHLFHLAFKLSLSKSSPA